jgi:uncharacterized protein (TIGR00725 family)
VRVLRLPVVAVLGSGEPDHGSPDLAWAVGRAVAEAGFHLLTGGGLGVMEDAGRGFCSVGSRAGSSIGIVPRAADGVGPKAGYPNPYVEIPVFTHLAGRLGPDADDSRNPINVLTAQRIVALPGGSGTRAEIRLAKRYSRPLLALVDTLRLTEEMPFLDFLNVFGVGHRLVERSGGGWVLDELRAFLTAET